MQKRNTNTHEKNKFGGNRDDAYTEKQTLRILLISSERE